MRISLNITARDSRGVVAQLGLVDVEVEWVPLDITDVGKTKEFRPTRIYQVNIDSGDYILEQLCDEGPSRVSRV
jgi:hypothetical protein